MALFIGCIYNKKVKKKPTQAQNNHHKRLVRRTIHKMPARWTRLLTSVIFSLLCKQQVIELLPNSRVYSDSSGDSNSIRLSLCSFTHLCRICVSVCAFRYAYYAVSEICEAIAIMTNLHQLDGDLTFENIKLFELLSHYVT